jgi:hypothetical protein
VGVGGWGGEEIGKSAGKRGAHLLNRILMGSAVEKYMGIITIGMSCADGVEKGPRAAGEGA